MQIKEFMRNVRHVSEKCPTSVIKQCYIIEDMFGKFPSVQEVPLSLHGYGMLVIISNM